MNPTGKNYDGSAKNQTGRPKEHDPKIREQKGGEIMSDSNAKSWEQYPLMLNVEQVGEILQMGKWTAYSLVHRADFPAVRIGKHKIRINRDELKKWLNEQRGKIE